MLQLRTEGILYGDGIREHDILSTSLSSQFFKKVKEAKAADKFTEDEMVKLPPPPPSVSIMENKRRETNAAVALMQERLQAMGILDKTSIHVRRRGEQKTDESIVADDLESSVSESSDVLEEKETDLAISDATNPKSANISASSDHKSDADGRSTDVHRNLESLDDELVEKMEDCRTATRYFALSQSCCNNDFHV